MGSIKLNWIFVCVCGVCVALVVPAAKLEQPGCDSPGVHGFPHLRRGQSSAAEVHSQARQVGQKTLASSRLHNSLTVDSSEGVSRPCSRVRETQGAEAGKQGQHGTASQPQCFDCGPQSDVSVLGRLTGSPSMSQAGIAQYEVKTKVCLTVWSWIRCLIATLMVPVHMEGARIHYSCSCSIFKISYCGAAGHSSHMHPASFNCCGWSEFKISVTAHLEPN